MFGWNKQQNAVKRQRLEECYATVADEMERGEIKSGLWAQATAECSGDEAKIRAAYMKLRAQALADLSLADSKKKIEFFEDALNQGVNDPKTLPKEMQELFDSKAQAQSFLARPKYQQIGYVKWVFSAETKVIRNQRIKQLNNEVQNLHRYLGLKLPEGNK